MPNYFNNFNQRTKILVIVTSIFLISVAVGLLVFGSNMDLHGQQLTADSLAKGAEALKLTH